MSCARVLRSRSRVDVTWLELAADGLGLSYELGERQHGGIQREVVICSVGAALGDSGQLQLHPEERDAIMDLVQLAGGDRLDNGNGGAEKEDAEDGSGSQPGHTAAAAAAAAASTACSGSARRRQLPVHRVRPGVASPTARPWIDLCDSTTDGSDSDNTDGNSSASSRRKRKRLPLDEVDATYDDTASEDEASSIRHHAPHHTGSSWMAGPSKGWSVDLQQQLHHIHARVPRPSWEAAVAEIVATETAAASGDVPAYAVQKLKDKLKAAIWDLQSEGKWDAPWEMYQHYSDMVPHAKHQRVSAQRVVGSGDGGDASEALRRGQEAQQARMAAAAGRQGQGDAKICASSLSGEQMAAAQRALAGESLFLTGAAGTGKSFLLRYIIQELRARSSEEDESTIAVTAPTGIAAINVHGTTIHSWAGIGQGRGERSSILKKVLNNRAASNSWRYTKCLVLDEVSMLGESLFDLLDYIGRSVRCPGDRHAKPFGGLQLILCGDFFQLPPVQARYAFLAKSWEEAGLEKGTVVLRQPHRQQNDPAFARLLNELRLGESFPRVYWVAVPEALRGRRVNRQGDGWRPRGTGGVLTAAQARPDR
jgi:hypothetical protein